MRKTFEHFLLFILLTVSVLLGLTFWLNTNFGFNLFSAAHWAELSSLQASHTPINKDFYLSIGVAIFVFIVGLYAIFGPHFRKIKINKPKQIVTPAPVPIKTTATVPIVPETTQNTPDLSEKIEPEQKLEPVTPEPQIQPITPQKTDTPQTTPSTIPAALNLSRPPKLHLPKNMAQIVASQHETASKVIIQQQESSQYDAEISKIFTDNFYVTKNNPTISGVKLNLFAIGGGEIVWVGGVNCSPETITPAISRLHKVFSETLEDIPITIKSFILDTNNTYKSSDEIIVFHSLDELSDFIAKNPGQQIPDSDREDFDAYSDYIDTVLTMLYKM